MARLKRDYEGERRTKGVTVQLTPTEREIVARRAAGAGRPVLSDYFRRCALEAPEAVAGVDAEAVRKIDAELRRVGNNLNQIAHHLNASGYLRSRQELDDCITDLKVAFARVIAL